MRILYIDIDSLRPDHLGCYGYHRNTSPNIDSLARLGVRFENIYVSDAPCLPSRTALFSGRFGIHSGVVNHEGVAADYRHDGAMRGFHSSLGTTSWMACLRQQGFQTATISPFGERHSAWWFYAGFSEIINTGKGGSEIAAEVEPVALDWLQRNGAKDHWFLHVNLWDAHTPYRTPMEYGNPFENDPVPSWLTEEVRADHWNGAGPESAQDAAEFQEISAKGYPHSWAEHFERQPVQMDSMAEVKRLFDGYDTGIRYADDVVGRIVAKLKELGIDRDTAVIISSDHGENLGELNIYGAHMTADEAASRVPLIMCWPGVTDSKAGQTLDALHSHVDMAATVIQLAGGTVPEAWDGIGFTESLRQGSDKGRECVVASQMAGSCQRAVRFDDYLCIRTYHDGYHCFPDWMVFNVREDRHMQHNLAAKEPGLVGKAAQLLDHWHAEAMSTGSHPDDPLWTVLQAGGPEHTRGCLPGYLRRLRATGRSHHAEQLERSHPSEALQDKWQNLSGHWLSSGSSH